MKKEVLLASVSIFSHMKKKDLKRIAAHAGFRDLHTGEVIIREGDYDNSLFVVVSGSVQAIKGLGGAGRKRPWDSWPRFLFWRDRFDRQPVPLGKRNCHGGQPGPLPWSVGPEQGD